MDVIGGIELAASAAIVIVVLAFASATTPRRRLALAAALGAWFLVVVVLGATYALDYEHGYGVPALGAAVILPIVAIATAVLAVPALREHLDRAPLSLLIGVNAVRLLGVSFVLLHFAGRLPAPFAPVAGWGDIFVGLTALPVAWASRQEGTRGVVLAWNTLGLADLIAAIALGVTSSPGPVQVFFGDPDASIMARLPWVLIPCFLVPCLLLTHLAVFYRLARTRERKRRMLHALHV